MRIEDCCLNISKAISVVALIGSPYTIANTRTLEVSRFKTSAEFTVKTNTSVDLINTANIAVNYLLKTRTFNVADDFSAPRAPRTEIGRKLLEHRRKALARGMTLLTANEINLMVKEGRGDFS